ncbi:MAG TPA: hypothetical protein VK203_31340, partial [Nostocaceae cyanobacterium]|nr:hypothetical protein [Nostocaceae cyanobacterium]
KKPYANRLSTLFPVPCSLLCVILANILLHFQFLNLTGERQDSGFKQVNLVLILNSGSWILMPINHIYDHVKKVANQLVVNNNIPDFSEKSGI